MLKKVHYLHIGRTGGTSLKKTIKNGYKTDEYIIKMRGHSISIDKISPLEPCFFFLRDPIDRFVSAFYEAAKKVGGPLHNGYKWTVEPNERAMLSKFKTPNELAEVICSDKTALKYMNTVLHLRPFTNQYLPNYKNRKHQVIFVGFFDSLSEDFERLKAILGLPENMRLAHENKMVKNKRVDLRLSPIAKANLLDFYSDDFEAYEYFKKWREK